MFWRKAEMWTSLYHQRVSATHYRVVSTMLCVSRATFYKQSRWAIAQPLLSIAHPSLTVREEDMNGMWRRDISKMKSWWRYGNRKGPPILCLCIRSCRVRKLTSFFNCRNLPIIFIIMCIDTCMNHTMPGQLNNKHCYTAFTISTLYQCTNRWLTKHLMNNLPGNSRNVAHSVRPIRNWKLAVVRPTADSQDQ
jgi:hypothetical protein